MTNLTTENIQASPKKLFHGNRETWGFQFTVPELLDEDDWNVIDKTNVQIVTRSGKTWTKTVKGIENRFQNRDGSFTYICF